MSAMTFELYPLRFVFRALDSIYFPPGKAGNVLRGYTLDTPVANGATGGDVTQAGNNTFTGHNTFTTRREIYTPDIVGTTDTQSDITCGTNLPGAVACTTGSYGTDEATAINAALSGGNIHLIVNGKYSLSTALVVTSNTLITALRPRMASSCGPARIPI